MFGNTKTARFVLTTDFASVAAATSAEQSKAMPAALGITQGCVALITPRADVGVAFSPARCTANAILVKITNPTAAPIDLASASYDVTVIYPSGEPADDVAV